MSCRKTYSSDYNSTSNYMRIPPRTGLEPWLTVKKFIISPILSPTLLQIYCNELIGPISIFLLGLGYNLWPYNNIFYLKFIFLTFWYANWLIKFLYSSSSNISFSIDNTLSILDTILLILILKNFFLQNYCNKYC